jgi:hypothetical protein
MLAPELKVSHRIQHPGDFVALRRYACFLHTPEEEGDMRREASHPSVVASTPGLRV